MNCPDGFKSVWNSNDFNDFHQIDTLYWTATIEIFPVFFLKFFNGKLELTEIQIDSPNMSFMIL